MWFCCNFNLTGWSFHCRKNISRSIINLNPCQFNSYSNERFGWIKHCFISKPTLQCWNYHEENSVAVLQCVADRSETEIITNKVLVPKFLSIVFPQLVLVSHGHCRNWTLHQVYPHCKPCLTLVRLLTKSVLHFQNQKQEADYDTVYCG